MDVGNYGFFEVLEQCLQSRLGSIVFSQLQSIVVSQLQWVGKISYTFDILQTFPNSRSLLWLHSPGNCLVSLRLVVVTSRLVLYC